jgi:hypothetical protein
MSDNANFSSGIPTVPRFSPGEIRHVSPQQIRAGGERGDLHYGAVGEITCHAWGAKRSRSRSFSLNSLIHAVKTSRFVLLNPEIRLKSRVGRS